MSKESVDGSSFTELNSSENLDHEIGQSSTVPGGKNPSPPSEPSPSVDDSSSMGCVKSRIDAAEADDDWPAANEQSNSKNSKRIIKEEENRNSFQDSRSKLSRRRRISTTFNDSDDENGGARSSWAKRDINDYRNGYPDIRPNSKFNDNYRFYTNKIPSHPNGDLIDDIHRKWYGDYSKLEHHHGFIQWLFPLREQGLNWSAQPLERHEIEKMQKDPQIMKRLIKSFELMLDFYGFELVDHKTCEIKRSSKCDYNKRFDNLNTSSHNYLRITRILKCLGEFGYENMKFQFLVAILRESIQENTLPRCLNSCRDYWIETLRDSEHRRIIRKYARDLIEAHNQGTTPPAVPTFKSSASGEKMDVADD